MDRRPNAQTHDEEEAAAQGRSQISERRFLQATETTSFYRQEYICPHGPGGREPPSPDERCPFPHRRAVPLGARQWGLEIEKDEQPSVTIDDGMSLVQKMKGKNRHSLNMQTQH